jgi:PAS domain S-box-containing protein
MNLSRKVMRVLVYLCLSIVLAMFLALLLFFINSSVDTFPKVAGTVGILCCLALYFLVNRVKRERNSIEAIAAQNAARYHAIIAASNTGAWEYHADTQYQWCSPEYFQMLGYNEQLFTKDNCMNIQDIWMRLLHPDDRQAAIEHFANYIASKSSHMYEASFRMKHQCGEWRWIWSRGRTLPGPDGSVSAIMLGTHTDITDRKAMEIELINYNERLLKYAHLTAHEVRGPVARLLGLVEVSKFADNVDYPWFLDKMYDQAQEIDKVLTVITKELTDIDAHHPLENIQA